MSERRILVAEDEAIAAMATQQMLEDITGAATEIVDNAEAAVQACEGAAFDLVLMDVRLKGEMTGLDAATLIRERFGIPVVLVTAYSPRDLSRMHDELPAFPFLTKPLVEEDLESALSKLL